MCIQTNQSYSYTIIDFDFFQLALVTVFNAKQATQQRVKFIRGRTSTVLYLSTLCSDIIHHYCLYSFIECNCLLL